MKSLFKALFQSSLLLLWCSTGWAAKIIDGALDSEKSKLVLRVAYAGETNAHKFELLWDECKSVGGVKQVAARLVDLNGDESARTEFEQVVKFDLSLLACRPGWLTIRSGRWSHITLQIE